MPFPWSMVIGFVLLAVGVALAVVGALVEGADLLVTIGTPIIGAGVGALTGKGADVVQAKVKKAEPPAVVPVP